MGIVNLEDMINRRPTVEEKLEAYYATATPEQVVKEFEALGVKLKLSPESEDIFDNPLLEGSILQQSIIKFQEEITNHLDREMDDHINKQLDEFKPITVEKKVISTNFKISNELADMWNNSPKAESVNSLSDPHLVAVADDFFNEIDEYKEQTLPTYLLSDPEIVGYPNLEFQEQIYDWVKGSLPTQGYTIKDLGCGRGDFFGHISKREEWEEKFKNIHYFGIELNPNLCNVGKQKYQEINILNNDYFEVDIKTDYTVCIGTLGDNLGQNKWENFNKTLNWAISNTKIAVILILQRDCYGNDAFFDYPFTELFENIDPNVKFVLDYSEMEDIYKLTVHIDGFNY